MDRGNGDASFDDLPWSSVFDPAANARAFSSAQAEGFRAASELVDRFVRIAKTGLNGAEWPTLSMAPLTNEQRADIFGATDVPPLIRSWWSVVGQLLLGSADPDSAVAEGPTIDLGNVESAGRLDLAATAPGVAGAEVWLHNRGTADFGEVNLHCSELLAHDGCRIAANEVRVDPGVVSMPPRSSRGVTIEVNVAPDVSPGIYRGTLVASTRSALWLPVTMTVAASL